MPTEDARNFARDLLNGDLEVYDESPKMGGTHPLVIATELALTCIAINKRKADTLYPIYGETPIGPNEYDPQIA